MILLDNQTIRNVVKTSRCQLTDLEVRTRSRRITETCATLCHPGCKIGYYLPIQNEVDISALYGMFHECCAFYVPHVIDETTMEFIRIDETTIWHENHFGIQEPVHGAGIHPLDLDLVFVPVVAFSSQCDRIGHGKGYYDRYLEQTMAKKIGVAYEVQRWEEIECFAHDVKLDAVITEIQTYHSQEQCLRYHSLGIRKASIHDAALLCKWWNDGAVMAHAGYPQGIQTTTEEVKQGLQNTDLHRLILMMDHRPVGEMMVQEVEKGIVMIGIKICELAKQNHGYGKQFLSMLIHEVFQHYGIHKIVLDTDVNNQRAQHVYETLGFQKLREKKHYWQDPHGVWHSAIDYELTQKTFQNILKG